MGLLTAGPLSLRDKVLCGLTGGLMIRGVGGASTTGVGGRWMTTFGGCSASARTMMSPSLSRHQRTSRSTSGDLVTF